MKPQLSFLPDAQGQHERGENTLTLPYQPHSSTSKAAAQYMRGKSGTSRRRVFEFIRENGPVMDEMIGIELAMNPSTVRPRRIELVTAGLVVQQGVRPVASGLFAAAWVAR